MTAPDLSLVSTDDLFDEVARRFDETVLGVTCRVNGEIRKTVQYYNGDKLICLGLAVNLQHTVQQKLVEDDQVTPGDDGVDDD